jgi:ABC-type multidrug transport system fused ATPase/permease subunit
MMRQSATVETYMTSVERINHYASNLELEEVVLKRAIDEAPSPPVSPFAKPQPIGSRPARFSLNKKDSSSNKSQRQSFVEKVANSVRSWRSIREPVEEKWPTHGEVVLNALRLRYRHDLPEVVKGITAKLTGGTKIGVVGRTGSGKSSLLLALSRLNEICGGRVIIDGVDTTEMTLEKLRKGIFVIRKLIVLICLQL